MAATSEARALPFFTDLYGQPLESGFIYIGQPGLDPVAYPSVVTSDIAGNVVVQQPIRTTHGHAAAAGALIHLFVQIPYSIAILDAAGRLVYASQNETDPVALAISSSSVQSASDLAALRTRSGSSTNQVWVSNIGMYTYDPADNTSPESVPFVIVGNDGSRYKLNAQYAFGPFMKAQSGSIITGQGVYLSWSDFNNDGAAYLTDNRGTGQGGFVFRTIDANNTVELGRVSFSAVGAILAESDITTVGNIVAQGGIVALLPDGSKSLSWDAGNSRYNLAGAPLEINGSPAVTQSTLSAMLPPIILANQQANGIGAVALGSSSSVNPVLPGTWSQTGSASSSVYLYVRVA